LRVVRTAPTSSPSLEHSCSLESNLT
jgi:hypothetical protein